MVLARPLHTDYIYRGVYMTVCLEVYVEDLEILRSFLVLARPLHTDYIYMGVYMAVCIEIYRENLRISRYFVVLVRPLVPLHPET